MLRPLLRFVLVAILFVALLPLVNGSTVFAADPVFTNVADILGGRRLLFPVDDLVVTLNEASDPVEPVIVQTENGEPGNQISYDVNDAPDTFATGTGRMFNLPRDVVVTLTTGTITIYDSDPNNPLQVSYPLNASAPVNQNQLARADFTGDGFADFAYIMQGSVYVVAAQDVNNIGAGVLVSYAGNPSFSTTGWTTLAAGDFNGDGAYEIALASAQTQGNTIGVEIFAVTPSFNTQGQLQSITLTAAGSAQLGVTNYAAPLYITAGNFAGAFNPNTAYPYHQIALLYEYAGGANGHVVELMSVNPSPNNATPATYTPTEVDTAQLIDSGVTLDWLTLTSGFINFYGQTEQIIAGYHEDGYNSYIDVLTMDNQLSIQYVNSTKAFTASNQGLVQVVLGNFDQETNSTGPIDLELAALILELDTFQNNCPLVSVRSMLYLFEIDPSNNFALTETTNAQVGGCMELSQTPPVMTLAAGDTQGRSLLLGAPSRITAQHIQPEVVLAMPPMHIDYVAPSGSPTPVPLNLSGVPGGFYSSYQTAVTNQNQSERKSTTSFSTALTESIDQKVSLGVPFIASVSVDTKTSASQMWENNVSKTYTNLNSQSFDASTHTGFGDQLWYVSERQNIYVYPVIGQYGCPESKPDCDSSEQVPLTMMFSGPDQVQPTTISGSVVEWYQPPQEPGNVFSYPWNLSQLQANQPNINLLTSNAPTAFYTDSSTLTEQANWANQTGQNVTSGSVKNYSWSKSVSISGNVSANIEGISFGGGTTYSFSYNGSKSFSTLNSSTTTLGQSTGIGVNKPGSFANPGEYEYAIAPYIFGTNPVTGTIQTLDLGTQIQTNGILTTGFTADPTDPNAGAWWGSAYSMPDLALNHPNRWNVSSQINITPNPSCLRIDSTSVTMNCATFNTPNTTNVWQSEFYWMKGFFITPADANGQGPQVDTATAGDQLLLETRVYNYSLTDMPPDSDVVVQFYVQPWNQATLQPSANAVLIENVGIGPIPGFNSNSNGGTLPNYATAGTVFDTTPYGDQYLVFWVLVVGKDQQGNPVTEMPQHGLTGIPPTLSSITEATDWTESYSNNVGLYKSLFYVEPASTEQGSHAEPESEVKAAERLQVDPIQLSTRTAQLNEQVIVSTNVRAKNPRDSVVVTFYRGDPNKTGAAFEVERLAHIRGGDLHRAEAIYRPDRCGTHNLFVQVEPGGRTASTKLEVTLNPRPVLRNMLQRLLEIFPQEKRGDGMIARLRQAKRFFRDNDNAAALRSLEKFKTRVTNQSGKSVPAEQADVLLAQTAQIFSCIKP